VSARLLLTELEERGISLRPSPNGNLRCKPQSYLTPEDILRIKEHKAELLVIVGGEYVASPASPRVPHFVKAEQELRARKASALGLVARFCWEEFGYISIHDPTTGEWHDVSTEQAPKWAKDEAFKRRDLYKAGEKRFLTQGELEEVWRKERGEEEKGIEDHVGTVVDAKGVLYEDHKGEE